MRTPGFRGSALQPTGRRTEANILGGDVIRASRAAYLVCGVLTALALAGWGVRAAGTPHNDVARNSSIPVGKAPVQANNGQSKDANNGASQDANNGNTGTPDDVTTGTQQGNSPHT